MNRRLKFNKVIFLLVLSMFLQVIMSMGQVKVQASSHDDIIKSLSLNKSKLTSKDEKFAIEARWEITQDGSAKAGDNFVLQLPDDFDLRLLRGRLPLIGSDGHIYGEGSIDKGNKSITFVFTDEVEKRNNVWGEFKIDGIMIDLKDPDPDKGIAQHNYELTTSVGTSHQVPIEINHDLYSDIDTGLNEHGQSEPHRRKNFDKIGQIHTGEEDTMYWYVYVNAKDVAERVDSQLFVEDILGPGHSITESDFSITLTDRSNDNESGTVLKEGTDLFNKYISNFKMQEDRKGYSFNFNPVAEGGQAKALRIYYHTRIDFDAPFDQTIFENYFNLDSSDGQKVGVPEEVDFGSMMGTGYGIENKTGEFKLFKIDEDGQPIKQAGIKFKLEVKEGKEHYYNRDMKAIELVTDEDGIARIDGIYSGYYTVTEIVAPDGYILSDEPQNILLNFSDLETTREELKSSNKQLKDLLDERNSRTDLESNPATKKWYDDAIEKEGKSIVKLERKMEKLLKQGIEFNFKNEKIDLIDLKTKKRWVGRTDKKDIKSEIYLIRKYLKYDENDNFQMIEEEVPNSRKEVLFSEEDQLIEWNKLPTSDQFKNNYSYFIVEEESEDFQMEHIFEDGELVIVNKLPEDVEVEEPKEPEGPGEETPEEPEEEPKEPVVEEKPEEPEGPGEEAPEEPEEGPKEPVVGEKPEEPEAPGEETPEEPEEGPKEPVVGEKPEEPEAPGKETPEEPEEEPKEPVVGEKPEEPEAPGEETPEEPEEGPKEPVVGEKPEEPEAPGKETPEEPEEGPKEPVVEEKPEEPEAPGKETPEEPEEEPKEPVVEEKPEEPEAPGEETPEEPEEGPKEPIKPVSPNKPEEIKKPVIKDKPKEPELTEENKPEKPVEETPEKPKSIKIETPPTDEEEVLELELIKDGKVVSKKPLILDKNNNWSGDFEGFESGVLSDYSINAVSSSGKKFKLKTGVKGYMILEEDDDEDDNFGVASHGEIRPDGPIDLLPQTGELPYTGLYLLGFAFIITGLIIRRKRF